MTAFWIARAKPRDMAGMRRYAEIVARIRENHPCETLARSGRFQVLEGTEHFDRYILHQYPSMEAALAFYYSPEYQEAAAIRRASCDGCELAIVEAGDLLVGS